ncbi:AMP-binding protein, partial [Morganella morganii]
VYVPVDPLGPVSRLEKILADSGARLVFSTASRLADLDALERRPRIVVLDDPACPLHWSHVELPASASAPEEIGEHDLAYILYTSGSTGTPKGVALSHRNALAFVE